MIGRFFCSPLVTVDCERDKPFGHARGQKGMVDAQTRVPLERSGLIIPEGIMATSRLNSAQGIRQAKPLQAVECCPCFRPYQCVSR